MIVAAILEDEDVDLLKVNVARIEANRVPLRKDPGNTGTVDAVITSSISARRNLNGLREHDFLSLIPLLCVTLLKTIRPLLPLFLDFS